MLFDYYQTDARLELIDFLWGGTFGFDPVPDAFSVNGFFVGDQWNITNVNRNESIRVRVINSAAYSTFTVSIDGLPLTLIELDGTVVEPLDMSKIKLYAAQRASFVVDWSRLNSTIIDSCSVYLRFELDPSIYPQYNKTAENFNIFGSTTKEPVDFYWKGLIIFNDTGRVGSPLPSYSESEVPVVNALSSTNQNILEATPVFKQIPPSATYNISIVTQFYLVQDNGIVRAFINDGMFPSSSNYYPIKATEPMLYSIMTADSPTLYSPTIVDGTIQGTGAVPFVLPYNEVIDIYIDGACCGAHPFHLHGHHFWIMATNEVPNACDIQGGNCLVRDVVTVPFGGWAVIRIISNNPGVWLFHCHLHWHFEMGLAATFIEAPDVLYERYHDGTLVPPADHVAMCSAETAIYRSELQSPSLAPTAAPFSTLTPSNSPVYAPSLQPSASPSMISANEPTISPSIATLKLMLTPLLAPTTAPSLSPSQNPTSTLPSESPSAVLSAMLVPFGQSVAPSTMPTILPTIEVTSMPSILPSNAPSILTLTPSSISPTALPLTTEPTEEPSSIQTTVPTPTSPTGSPTKVPVAFPPIPVITFMPSEQPTTVKPSSMRPSSAYPASIAPTSCNPSQSPTAFPSTLIPSTSPSAYQTQGPSEMITMDDDKSSLSPSYTLISAPSSAPSRWSNGPTNNPTVSSLQPALRPTNAPSSSSSPSTSSLIIKAQFTLILSYVRQSVDQSTLMAITQAVADAVELPYEQFTIINSAIIPATNQVQVHVLSQYLSVTLESTSNVEDILPGLTFSDDTNTENMALMVLKSRLDESLNTGNFTSLLQQYNNSSASSENDDGLDVISALVTLVNNIAKTLQPTMAPTMNITSLNDLKDNNHDSKLFSSRLVIILTSTLGAIFLILTLIGLWKTARIIGAMQQRAIRDTMTPQHENDFGFIVVNSNNDENEVIEGRNPQIDGKDNYPDFVTIV